MKNKDYIKKGEEFHKDLKSHSYGFFIITICLVILFVILCYFFR